MRGALRGRRVLAAGGAAASAAVVAIVAGGGGGGGLPPLGQPSCVEGATTANTAASVRSTVQNGQNVCVTAVISDEVNLDGLTSTTVRHVGTQGSGDFAGGIVMDDASKITMRIKGLGVLIEGSSSDIILEQCDLGGTATERFTFEAVVRLRETITTTNNITVQDCDIGYTFVTNNEGAVGFGIRAYGNNNNLTIRRNKIHNIAADAIQIGSGDNVVVDRNEIGPVGTNPGTLEHSDSIQVTGNGPGLQITNNWIFNQGYYDGQLTDRAGTMYIHGGSTGSVLIENNLVADSQGRTEVCGLGTGGNDRQNVTIRRNTFTETGRATEGTVAGFEWDCDTGSGNLIDRNIAVDSDGGFFNAGSAASVTLTDNLFGTPSLVTLDAARNCTSANCNPAGQDPIGYRKPSGVHW